MVEARADTLWIVWDKDKHSVESRRWGERWIVTVEYVAHTHTLEVAKRRHLRGEMP